MPGCNLFRHCFFTNKNISFQRFSLFRLFCLRYWYHIPAYSCLFICSIFLFSIPIFRISCAVSFHFMAVHFFFGIILTVFSKSLFLFWPTFVFFSLTILFLSRERENGREGSQVCSLCILHNTFLYQHNVYDDISFALAQIQFKSTLERFSPEYALKMKNVIHINPSGIVYEQTAWHTHTHKNSHTLSLSTALSTQYPANAYTSKNTFSRLDYRFVGTSVVE